MKSLFIMLCVAAVIGAEEFDGAFTGKCPDTLIAIGLRLDSADIGETLSDSLKTSLNNMISVKVAKFAKEGILTIGPEMLQAYRRCIPAKYIQYRFNSFRLFETSEGMAEGTLDFSIEFYRSYEDKNAYLKTTVIVTGKPGQSPAESLANAIEAASGIIVKKLKSKT